MSYEACAALVEANDPDRFRAAMAMPLPLRRRAFPIYAFALEVSRAPWVSEEPMISEMRLQWWRDALEEIAEGREVRRHEVTTPLAEVLSAEEARTLDATVAARRWDIYKEPFEGEAHFDEYLTKTSALPMMAVGQDPRLEGIGWATGLARFLIAVPRLQERGRFPLLDPEDAAVRALAQRGLAKLWRLPNKAGLEGFLARAILMRAARSPVSVFQGLLSPGPFQSAWALTRAGITSRI